MEYGFNMRNIFVWAFGNIASFFVSQIIYTPAIFFANLILGTDDYLFPTQYIIVLAIYSIIFFGVFIVLTKLSKDIEDKYPFGFRDFGMTMLFYGLVYPIVVLAINLTVERTMLSIVGGDSLPTDIAPLFISSLIFIQFMLIFNIGADIIKYLKKL